MKKNQDFHCPEGAYLLSHSVGRPLKSQTTNFQDVFLSPWAEEGAEPWGQWLKVIEQFRHELSVLFNGKAEDFCPQVNLSSALTKIIQSHQRLSNKPRIVMSEQDFPSMGFVLQNAPLDHAEISLIPADSDSTDTNVWHEFLKEGADLVFISHVYSNTGQKTPIEEIVTIAKEFGVMSLVDVAQSAGVIHVNLQTCQPDFLIGSSVKWLCGGPGAGYLWVNPNILHECQPKDVGWFSHENPFEFNIHDFRYHESALKFWGGTPQSLPMR
ncbi:aminotransferase class V-fold PLP-dependent enzyme [Veronia nyctiphanis]|uniref:aminotransferase class V-fold PLP-dependent enzyme n=1 Tax=Veronia nyctiphanis TaxID=1278244 RepID=UPI00191C6788|nr:aminotransferase class V-fold PLP-dependent enzyme [Veronia nyctiphanis]